MSDLVFVSYSRRNAQRVRDIVHDLRARGFMLWVDLADIPASTPWKEEIEQAVRSCVVTLVFDSLESSESENCRHERDLARNYQKPVVTVDLESTTSETVADEVAVALRRVTDLERNRADVLGWSLRWDSARRPKRYLPSPAAYRKQYRHLRGMDEIVADQHARAFLTAARRRAVMARATKIVVACMLFVGLCAGTFQRIFNEEGTRYAQERDARAQRLWVAKAAASADPYEGLQQTLAVVDAARSRLDAREALLAMHEINVPIGVRAGQGDSARGKTSSAACGSHVPPEGVRSNQGKRTARVDTAGRLSVTDGHNSTAILTSGPPRCIRWSADDKHLAADTSAGVEIFDAVSGMRWQLLRGQHSAINFMMFSDGGRHFTATTADGKDLTWALHTATSWESTGHWLTGLIRAHDIQQFGALSRDGKLHLIDQTGHVVRTISLQGDGFTASMTRVPGMWVVAWTGGRSAVGSIVTVQDDGTQTRVTVPDCALTSLSNGLSSNTAVVACGDNRFAEVRLDAKTVQKHSTSIDSIRDVARVGNSLVLRSVYDEYSLVNSRGEVKPLIGGLSGCASVSHLIVPLWDDTTFVSAGPGPGCTSRYRTHEGRWSASSLPDTHISDRGCSVAAASPRAPVLALGMNDGRVILIDAEQNEPLRVIYRGGSPVRGLAFNADGSSLLIATRAGDLVTVPVSGDVTDVSAERGRLAELLRVGIDGGLATRR